MCTNTELKKHIRNYAMLKAAAADLEKQIEEEKKFIIAEMDNRKTLEFEGKKIITERLQETATKAGKDVLKAAFGSSEIDKYLTVSLARFINTANAKKF